MNGEDILIGGTGNDAIDGGNSDDLIFGDAVQLFRRDVQPGPVNPSAISNPRYQTLIGTQIYSTADATLGQPLNDGIAQGYRDANGTYAPDWSEYTIGYLDSSYAIQSAGTTYGSDYIAGGAGDDEIFGQLGNDVIQGDGSIPAPFTSPTATPLELRQRQRRRGRLGVRPARRSLPRRERRPADPSVAGQHHDLGRRVLQRRERLHRRRRR